MCTNHTFGVCWTKAQSILLPLLIQKSIEGLLIYWISANMKTDVIKTLDEWLSSIMYAYYRKLVHNLLRNTLLTLLSVELKINCMA